uniref:Ovule protein n=1 Tax=Caenorhabditis tropicalis TaxID=1561998 RepID=A0A1I7TCQ2_9PELO
MTHKNSKAAGTHPNFLIYYFKSVTQPTIVLISFIFFLFQFSIEIYSQTTARRIVTQTTIIKRCTLCDSSGSHFIQSHSST